MYRDIDFKFTHQDTYGVLPKVGIAAINQSIRNIIMTVPGERIGDPLYGCTVKKYLFEKINYVTSNGIKIAIADSLEAYEPRIVINNITVEPDFDMSQYNVYINYSIKDIQSSINVALNLSVQE